MVQTFRYCRRTGLCGIDQRYEQRSGVQSGATLDKIKSSGTITLGYRESSFGFSYLDSNLKPVGYSMDICYQILEAVKASLKLDVLKVNYQAVTSANRIPLVQNGTVDLECGSTTNLVERQKLVAFLPDIFRYNVRMLVKKDGIKVHRRWRQSGGYHHGHYVVSPAAPGR